MFLFLHLYSFSPPCEGCWYTYYSRPEYPFWICKSYNCWLMNSCRKFTAASNWSAASYIPEDYPKGFAHHPLFWQKQQTERSSHMDFLHIKSEVLHQTSRRIRILRTRSKDTFFPFGTFSIPSRSGNTLSAIGWIPSFPAKKGFKERSFPHLDV